MQPAFQTVTNSNPKAQFPISNRGMSPYVRRRTTFCRKWCVNVRRRTTLCSKLCANAHERTTFRKE